MALLGCNPSCVPYVLDGSKEGVNGKLSARMYIVFSSYSFVPDCSSWNLPVEVQFYHNWKRIGFSVNKMCTE
jgi:hypothetical protein